MPDERELGNLGDAEVGETLQALVSTVRESRNNVLKLFEAVKKVRDTYSRMLGVQKEKFVSEDIELNFNLLEVEEMLVELGLLTIEDIKRTREGNRRRLILYLF
jgi:hypothetical protein